MAATTKCQKVSDLRTFLRKLCDSQSIIETDEFHVIDIQRYLTDPRHQAQISGSAGQALDVIQATLADESHKIKALLHSDLNSRIQKFELRIGSSIKLKKCSLHYDESDLSGSGMVIVQDVEITGLVPITDQELQGLQWSPDCSEHEKDDVPLTSGRGYFVNLWSSMEMTGPAWITEDNILQGLGDTREQDLYGIKDLATKWNSVRTAKPAILVRVIMKSRLIHYAKPSKDDKWPFQAQILVADRTGACTAVLWNDMCPKFYHRFREGCILLLKGFTVKKSFQFIPRFRPALKDLDYYDIDINLNSHHPASEVRLIDPATLSDTIQLVPLRHRFLNRKQVGSLPNNTVCDIVAVVTYIGRFEREPIVNKHGFDSGGFWIRRWLHLLDRSSWKPFIVQVYRLAEGMRGQEIEPGSVLMISNVRVLQKLSQESASQGQRYTCLSTTAESQVTMVTETSSESIRDQPTVKAVIDWSKSSEGRRAVSRSLVGGYFNYPPLPSSVPEIKTALKDQSIISSEDWLKTFSGLSYREGRQLMVQAVMVCVKMKNLEAIDRVRSPSPRKRRQQKQIQQTSQEVILDSTVYDSEERLHTLGIPTTDCGTLPVTYTASRWDIIKKWLDFSCSDQFLDSESQNTKQVPYFIVEWLGLNTRILLQTILLCPHELQPDTPFLDILSGQGLVPSSLVSDTQYTVSEQGVNSLMDSVRQCANKRFLLVLDCYQGDGEQTEIILNRALPVGEV